VIGGGAEELRGTQRGPHTFVVVLSKAKDLHLQTGVFGLSSGYAGQDQGAHLLLSKGQRTSTELAETAARAGPSGCLMIPANRNRYQAHGGWSRRRHFLACLLTRKPEDPQTVVRQVLWSLPFAALRCARGQALRSGRQHRMHGNCGMGGTGRSARSVVIRLSRAVCCVDRCAVLRAPLSSSASVSAVPAPARVPAGPLGPLVRRPQAGRSSLPRACQ
jgi:hypothetical protein